ncbi:TetR-like C-terminal domain-containing protein [Actinomadura barringtoniae]
MGSARVRGGSRPRHRRGGRPGGPAPGDGLVQRRRGRRASARRLSGERGGQLQAMLDRARERGASPPDGLETLDHIPAPMYIRTLFGMESLSPAYINALVDCLLDR